MHFFSSIFLLTTLTSNICLRGDAETTGRRGMDAASVSEPRMTPAPPDVAPGGTLPACESGSVCEGEGEEGGDPHPHLHADTPCGSALPPPADTPSSGMGRDKPFHCHVTRPGMNKLARNQLLIVSVLCLVFMICEILGGTISNSLALVTDATHLASDLMSFLISLFAILVAGRPPSAKMSFGYHRAEVLGALVSVLIIWVTTGVLVYLAVQRVINQSFEIEANTMLITAGIGVAFNIVMGIVLNTSRCGCQAVSHAHGGHGHSHSHSSASSHSHNNQGHTHLHETQPQGHSQPGGASQKGGKRTENNNVDCELNSAHAGYEGEGEEEEEEEGWGEAQLRHRENINVRAAFIHVIGDLIQSIGVFIAAIVIKVKPEYKLADPICTFLFSVLVLFTTITILRDTLMVLLEAVPRNLNYRMCKFDLETLEGVKSVHSLNVWALTMDKNVVTAHLAVAPDADRRGLLETSVLLLRDKYRAFHTTIQMEDYEHEVMTDCEDCRGPLLL